MAIDETKAVLETGPREFRGSKGGETVNERIGDDGSGNIVFVRVYSGSTPDTEVAATERQQQLYARHVSVDTKDRAVQTKANALKSGATVARVVEFLEEVFPERFAR